MPDEREESDASPGKTVPDIENKEVFRFVKMLGTSGRTTQKA